MCGVVRSILTLLKSDVLEIDTKFLLLSFFIAPLSIDIAQYIIYDIYQTAEFCIVLLYCLFLEAFNYNLMQIRKERTHQCGLSNIDFKTRKDEEGFKTFKEDFRSTQFGTMGKTALKKLYKPSDEKSHLKVTAGFQLAQPPNPIKDSPIKYYEKTGKEFKEPQLVSPQKDSKLESMKFDGKPYIGEDVKLNQWYNHQAQVYKATNDGDTSDKTSQGNEKEKDMKALNIKGDKQEKNEKAITETQLVKVKNKNTMEGRVDTEKVRGIRRAIRRRYANRTDFRKLFNTWDRSSKGFIDPTDAYNMISKLGIKINMDEASVLVSSADNGHKGNIGMDEFMSLIFGSEDSFNVDLKKLKPIGDKGIIQDSQGLADEMSVAATNLRKIEEFNEIRQLLKRKLPDLFSDVQYGKMERQLNYEGFKNVILEKAGLPEKYTNENYIHKLYNGLPSNNGNIDFLKFLESIRNFTTQEHSGSDLGSPKRVKKEAIQSPEGTVRSSSTSHAYITGKSKIPMNKLDSLIEKAKKFTHIVQNKYGSEKELETMFSTKFGDGRIIDKNIEAFFTEELKPQLLRREITRDDIHCFLFALPYDNTKATTIQNITSNAYWYMFY
jgi:Ca2+-binding EF-hand superfamily protein